MIGSGRDASTLAMTLSMIRRDVASLRAEVAALDLAPRESARFLAALSLIERRADGLAADVVARVSGH
ncbi:MAG TPA: hypothetical protein VHK90_04215 [Thermoanaerobaculia bacterium]|nr:hypothetical protein [Thermoanaerobaculia bacterium]